MQNPWFSQRAYCFTPPWEPNIGMNWWLQHSLTHAIIDVWVEGCRDTEGWEVVSSGSCAEYSCRGRGHIWKQLGSFLHTKLCILFETEKQGWLNQNVPRRGRSHPHFSAKYSGKCQNRGNPYTVSVMTRTPGTPCDDQWQEYLTSQSATAG